MVFPECCEMPLGLTAGMSGFSAGFHADRLTSPSCSQYAFCRSIFSISRHSAILVCTVTGTTPLPIYRAGRNSDTAPTASTPKKATDSSPDAAIPMSTSGRNTMVTRIFVTLQAAFTANQSSFPNTEIMRIIKISVSKSVTPVFVFAEAFLCVVSSI